MNIKTTSDNEEEVRRDKIYLITKELRKKSRLSLEDKKKFAENLGRLAEEINPSKPITAVKTILKTAEREDLLSKRARYFRFSYEKSKREEYASTPQDFINLATAVGMLKSENNPSQSDREKRDALRQLYKGSSYLPDYSPSNPADLSAINLLTEYTYNLCQAIKERTSLLELWQTLEHTNIDVLREHEFSEENYSKKDINLATKVPKDFNQILNQINTTDDVHFFIPADKIYLTEGRNAWANPEIKIGYVFMEIPARVFVIPKEDRRWFKIKFDPRTNSYHDSGSYVERAKWLKSIGVFDNNNRLPEITETDEFRRTKIGWQQAKFNFPFEVFFGLRKNLRGQPDVYLKFESVEHDDNHEWTRKFAVKTRMTAYNCFDNFKQSVISNSYLFKQSSTDSSIEEEIDENYELSPESYDNSFEFHSIFSHFIDLEATDKPEELEPFALVPYGFYSNSDLGVIEEEFIDKMYDVETDHLLEIHG